MIYSLGWVTNSINIQHFILINSSNFLNDHFYFLLKKVQFSPVLDTPFQQFINYTFLIIKFLRHCRF